MIKHILNEIGKGLLTVTFVVLQRTMITGSFLSPLRR
jgi:hypothetical protein